MSVRSALLDLLFPPKCPFCGRVLEHSGICPRCEKALPWIEDGQGLWECDGGVVCAAPLWYQELAREGILRFKFQGMAAAAEPLGELVARCAAERFSGEFDTVTWVPVSKKRLRQRGYDQARLLAEAACRLWDTKPVKLLEKVRDNPAQSGIGDAAARRENARDVYAPAPGGEAAGKRVLLVDDICTTGATLAACAQALTAGGAARVMCVTAARTPVKKNVHKVPVE